MRPEPGCRSCRWSTASASRGRRCASRWPSSSTRGSCSNCPAAATSVREFTKDDIRDAIELRGVLEGTAARFAAERGPKRSDLRTLTTINEQIAELVHQADYESFEQYLLLNDRFHARLLKMARSPMLERALEHALTLPFAGPGAMVLAEAELPESRDILIIAQRHHQGMIEALELRQGTRAEGIAREHALIALRNLEIVLSHREVLERIPGASLFALPQPGTPEPV